MISRGPFQPQPSCDCERSQVSEGKAFWKRDNQGKGQVLYPKDMALKSVGKEPDEQSGRLWQKKQEMNEQLYFEETRPSLLSYHEPEE